MIIECNKMPLTFKWTLQSLTLHEISHVLFFNEGNILVA